MLSLQLFFFIVNHREWQINLACFDPRRLVFILGLYVAGARGCPTERGAQCAGIVSGCPGLSFGLLVLWKVSRPPRCAGARPWGEGGLGGSQCITPCVCPGETPSGLSLPACLPADGAFSQVLGGFRWRRARSLTWHMRSQGPRYTEPLKVIGTDQEERLRDGVRGSAPGLWPPTAEAEGSGPAQTSRLTLCPHLSASHRPNRFRRPAPGLVPASSWHEGPGEPSTEGPCP